MFKGEHNVGDRGKDDKFVVVNKLSGGVLKTGDNQGKVHGKIRLKEWGNNKAVRNEVDDKYKKDRQPRMLVPNLCARNSLVDKYHNGSDS